MNLCDELPELNELMNQIPDDRGDFNEDLNRLPSMTAGEYRHFMKRRSETQFGEIWARYRTVVLQLADRFIVANDAERDFILKSVESQPLVRTRIVRLIREMTWNVRTPQDAPIVRSLLVLLAIGRFDLERGITQLVSDLYFSACDASIDFYALLETVLPLLFDGSGKQIARELSAYLSDFVPNRSWR